MDKKIHMYMFNETVKGIYQKYVELVALCVGEYLRQSYGLFQISELWTVTQLR